MKMLDKVVGTAEELLAVAGMSAMSIITILAVFFRYVLSNPIIWAEEAARYLMVWSTMIGISIATRQKAHLGIDILVSLAPKNLQKALEILSAALMIVMYVFLVLVSILFIQNAIKTGNVSPMLRIPFYLIYLALPIGFGLSAVRGVQVLLGVIRGRDEKGEVLV